MEDKVMAQGERLGGTWRQAAAHGPETGLLRCRVGSALAGAALGLTMIVAVSATGCDSGAQVAADTTTTATAAGQTGPTGRPTGGMPPLMGANTSTTAATTATTLAETTTTTLAEGSYSDGVYLVGTDIASGLYKGTVNGGSGHWEITRDANGERFVAAGDPVGQFYVKVTSGRYLRLTGVTIAKAATTAADPLLSSGIGAGTFRVGYDISSGWYQGTVDDHLGYWEITSDANGQTLVASDYVTGPFTLNVKSGQYLTLRGVSVSQ
jgi:hypothetical protein